jgi:hypothetical protein
VPLLLLLWHGRWAATEGGAGLLEGNDWRSLLLRRRRRRRRVVVVVLCLLLHQLLLLVLVVL